MGYRISFKAHPEEVWKAIVEIGGPTGWYYGHLLWKIRAWFDRLIGGIGFRGGRRHPTELLPGDALDFWRVLEIGPPSHLMLIAEMKLPGEAILEFKIRPLPDGGTELEQISRFLPRGLGGILYWYGLYPFHRLLYPNLLKAIGKAIRKPILKGPERITPKNKGY